MRSSVIPIHSQRNSLKFSKLLNTLLLTSGYFCLFGDLFPSVFTNTDSIVKRFDVNADVVLDLLLRRVLTAQKGRRVRIFLRLLDLVFTIISCDFEDLYIITMENIVCCKCTATIIANAHTLRAPLTWCEIGEQSTQKTASEKAHLEITPRGVLRGGGERGETGLSNILVKRQ